MEGDSAVQAVYGGRATDPDVADQVQRMREDYEHQLDARFAAARGFVDAIVTPEEVRHLLAFALRVTSHYRGPHIGPFVLPPLDARVE
jgi:acetyl-CoA carboxylase carboxyltransferase component